MKKTLFIALAILSVIACTKPDNSDVKKPLLTLTSETSISFDYNGGEGEITYTLENPVEGVDLEVKHNDNWITDVTVGESITFKVGQNPDSQDRFDVITVSYQEQNFTVTILQEGYSTQEENYDFNILSEGTMTFDCTGGVGEIIYQIDNPVEGAVIEINCDEQWISDFNVGETITFNVAENTSSQERTQEITLTYIEYTYTIEVIQEGSTETPNDYIEHTVNFLEGIYYGTQFSSAHNYYIYLSDIGINGEDKFKPFSNNFRLDIYSNTSSSASSPVLPIGTYTIDPENTCAAGTVSVLYSAYVVMGESQIESVYGFEDGTLTVSENRIELIATLSDGKQHRIVYEGSLEFTMP